MDPVSAGDRLYPQREQVRNVVKKHLRWIAIGFVLSISFLCSSRAAAQVDPWEFEVYPYATLPRGMIELETDNAVVPNGHSKSGSGTAKGTYSSQGMWYNAYELTYGLTDRIEAAAYLNLAIRAAMASGGRA